MEAGNSNANLKKDNSIDSSDSPIFDDTEVSDTLFHLTHLPVPSGACVSHTRSLATDREYKT